MSGMSHIERVEHAIACEKVDRTAYNNFDGGLLGRWANDEFMPGDEYTRPEWAMDQIVQGGLKMGGDIAPGYIYGPMMNSDDTGITYNTPGKELPADNVFQVLEHDLLDEAGIDFILENGVQAWEDAFIVPTWPKDIETELNRGAEFAGVYAQKCTTALPDDPWYDLPLPANGGPFLYSMVRGFEDCLIDMYEEPDRTRQVMQMFAEWEMSQTEAMFADFGGLTCVNVAAARFDDRSAGLASFDEVCWPVYRWYIEYARERDLQVIIHADGYWTNVFTEHISEFTPKKTIIQLDGFTDIDKVAEGFVKNKICMMGEIPPSMLFMNNPQAVYKRTMHLKELFGSGLILSSGCGAPYNTDFENLAAFIEAANTPL